MDKSKPFGLIIPKRAKTFQTKSKSVFDSDSDDETNKKPSTKIPQAKPLPKKVLEAELCEDPSIYEYDTIYDDMKAKEVAKTAPKAENRPSRYIDSLLKSADKRKKNYERRLEKKVQTEREKEGDKFKDKEAFVTTAYKKKMQEMEEEEERERRENELNDMMDVTKQKDLSGFYRHFLKQSIGEEKIPVFGERSIEKEPESTTPADESTSIKKEPESPKSHTEESNVEVHSPEKELDPNLDRDSDISLSDDDDDSSDSKEDKGDKNGKRISSDGEKEEPKSKKRKFNRQIRKRFDSESASENESDEEPKEKLTKRKHSETRHDPKKDTEKESDRPKGRSDSEESVSNPALPENTKLNDLANAEKLSKEASESNEEKKPKKNIFEKRTVGAVFAEAQARYFQRMSARAS